MENNNRQKEMENILRLAKEEKTPPLVLLHSCCAPCSSAVVETLAPAFALALFYYNPNIFPREEYEKRKAEERRLIGQMPVLNPLTFIEGDYEPGLFFVAAAGLEEEKEGGKRCAACFRLRLKKAAEEAKKIGARYFATTLSVSPHKSTPLIHRVGEEIERETGVAYLPGDFKKRGGYERSLALSAKYGLYRQNYCGCKFSLKERIKK